MHTPASSQLRVRPTGRMAAIAAWAVLAPFLATARPPAPTLPVLGDLPDRIDLAKPDVKTVLSASKKGVGPVTIQTYRYHGQRLPVWFQVEIATGANAGAPKQIDLYDIGVQGRDHKVLVRLSSGQASLKIIERGIDVTPVATNGFFPVPGCGGQMGLPGPCQATLTTESPTCVLECAYFEFCDFDPNLNTTRQPDDGSPPPTRPGQQH